MARHEVWRIYRNYGQVQQITQELYDGDELVGYTTWSLGPFDEHATVLERVLRDLDKYPLLW